ncbi:MAG: lytic transglycosylase domain-containing protein [Pseudonocardiaceae bacterium]
MRGDERAGARTGQSEDELPAGDELPVQPRRKLGGYVLRGLLSAGALACAGLVVATLGGLAAPLPDRGIAQPAPAVMAAPAALPTVPEPVRSPVVPQPPAPAEGQPEQQTGTELPSVAPQVAFSEWASRVAPVTGIPQRALQAYANAHAAMAATETGCQLTWVTLAGIALIESNHGSGPTRSLDPDGRPSSPIIGVPLNGGPGVRAIADTDGGFLDGDRVWDRAVGPFQFIPSTWANWRSDGDGDGVAEPQDIDDAAVSAARYLCAGGRNLATGEGWLQAILSYNNSVPYVQNVYTASQTYARTAADIT